MRLTRTMLVLAASGLAFAVPSYASSAKSAKNADGSERKICRTFPETGSLVKRVRVCKTASQWAADSAMLKQMSGVTSCSMQPCEVPGK